MAQPSALPMGVPADGDALSHDTSDSELLARIRDDDRAAFRLLLRRHLARAYGLARRITGSASEAEDIAQDAFLQIWQRRAHWNDDGAKFTTWLYRVVTNRAIDHRRRPRSEDIETAGDFPSDGPDALDAIHRSQVTHRLREAQQKLPEQQRVAVALYYFEGLSAAGVADVMNTSVGAVESLLKRARQNLRRSLKGMSQAVVESFDDR